MAIVEAGSVDERDLRIVGGKCLHDKKCHCYEQQLCVCITFISLTGFCVYHDSIKYSNKDRLDACVYKYEQPLKPHDRERSSLEDDVKINA